MYYRTEHELGYSFGKYLSNIYYVPGKILGARVSGGNEKEFLPSWSLHYSKESQKISKQKH